MHGSLLIKLYKLTITTTLFTIILLECHLKDAISWHIVPLSLIKGSWLYQQKTRFLKANGLGGSTYIEACMVIHYSRKSDWRSHMHGCLKNISWSLWQLIPTNAIKRTCFLCSSIRIFKLHCNIKVILNNDLFSVVAGFDFNMSKSN